MKSRHILILTDRDWTHPQGGGTGTNLYGQVSRWVAAGHRVTVIAGDYPGAAKQEQLAPGLVVHRMGSRTTVFPRAAWAVRRRGIGAGADVVLEVINGITFLTPLWLRKPRVALVHHVHRDHYATELGLIGRLAALVLETLPLRFLYSGATFLTISNAARADLVAGGVPAERIHVAYLGVDTDGLPEAVPSPGPRLLYLGRLKQYKRVERVLDVLEAIPDARLDIAGDGDHRPALEEEIAARGLDDRVVLHGHVSEEEKYELYGRAWVSLTASSAEGWCLTVMEAAAVGTPSAALRVGGLPESILDGETGLLADTPEELADKVADLVAHPERREALGAAARVRAKTFTWDRTAAANLAVLDAEADAGRAEGLRGISRRLAASDTAKATGLALASVAASAVQFVFVLVFARLFGVGDYGSLVALVSTFLILSVPGQALQVAAARESALGRLGAPHEMAATVARWTGQLGLLIVGLTGLGIVLREPLAALIGVEDVPWAAAFVLPTGGLWLLVSILRGVLQGVREYALAGGSIILESIGRLVGGLVLFGLGFGVTGAYLGTPVSMLIVAIVLYVLIHRRLGAPAPERRPHPLAGLLRGAWAPIIGLTFLAVLQNADVPVVKNQLGDEAGGHYAAAAVAAKATIWVAVGIGMYLLPEATRLAAAGQDPRPALRRALILVSLVAAPALAIYTLAPGLLLRIAFGAEYTNAADALPVLGLAMVLLACAYLAVQYLLALGRRAFLWTLLVVAAVLPVLLSGVSSLEGAAGIILAVQAAAAAAVLVLSFRRLPRLDPAPA